MISYTSFSSSSEGNSGLVSCAGAEGNIHILLDAGISARRIKTSLAQIGLSLDDISFILITHYHSDHTKGLETLLRGRALRCMYPGDYIPGVKFCAGSLEITPFPTLHDSQGSCGFRFDDGMTSLAFATDLGRITSEVEGMLLGAELVVLESNYDEGLLWNGPYPERLKRRIASDYGHLSNDQCSSELAYLARHGMKKAALAHLSKTNNTNDIAKELSERALCGSGCSVCVLERNGITELCLP